MPRKDPAPRPAPRAGIAKRSMLPSLPALAAVYKNSRVVSLSPRPSPGPGRSSPPRSSSPQRHMATSANQPRKLAPLRTVSAEEAVRERRKADASHRRSCVLAQRLEALAVKQEREARHEVALAEKSAFHAISRLSANESLKLNHDGEASKRGNCVDPALQRHALLAQGSPVRSRRVARGVGLGIGGIMHAASPYDANMSGLSRMAGPTAAVYRAHDTRTDKSRAMATKVRYPHNMVSPRGTPDTSTHAYELRLLTVRESQARAGVEGDCVTKLQWLYDAELRARRAAIERARQTNVSAADASRRRRLYAEQTACAAINAALDEREDSGAAIDDVVSGAIRAALRSRRRAQLPNEGGA